MTRLNRRKVVDLPRHVVLPKYNRNTYGMGITHLGIGAFHRAHQAVYTDTAIGIEGGDWGICGVSLRGPGVRDQLAPQDHLFTVVEKTEAAPRYRLIGSVGLEVRGFASAREYLEQPAVDVPCCLVLDVRMPGLSGLDLQQKLNESGEQLPVIFMTGHGTVPMSVRAKRWSREW